MERRAGAWSRADLAGIGSNLNSVWSGEAEVWAVGDGGIVWRQAEGLWTFVDSGALERPSRGRAGGVLLPAVTRSESPSWTGHGSVTSGHGEPRTQQAAACRPRSCAGKDCGLGACPLQHFERLLDQSDALRRLLDGCGESAELSQHCQRVDARGPSVLKRPSLGFAPNTTPDRQTASCRRRLDIRWWDEWCNTCCAAPFSSCGARATVACFWWRNAELEGLAALRGLRLKYRFEPDEPSHRYRSLLLSVLGALATASSKPSVDLGGLCLGYQPAAIVAAPEQLARPAPSTPPRSVQRQPAQANNRARHKPPIRAIVHFGASAVPTRRSCDLRAPPCMPSAAT